MKNKPLMIAHRGASKYELENTIESFIAAGNRSFYGIETDLRVTKDRKIIAFHDEDFVRLAGLEKKVNELNLKKIKKIPLKGNFTHIENYYVPAFAEYLNICLHYNKIPVVEIKAGFDHEMANLMISELSVKDLLSKVIIISFDLNCLIYLRKILPNGQIQFLAGNKLTQEEIETCLFLSFDLNVHYQSVTKELVDLMHENKLKINCWTVDDLDIANKLIEMGVDYITTNGLE